MVASSVQLNHNTQTKKSRYSLANPVLYIWRGISNSTGGKKVQKNVSKNTADLNIYFIPKTKPGHPSFQKIIFVLFHKTLLFTPNTLFLPYLLVVLHLFLKKLFLSHFPLFSECVQSTVQFLGQSLLSLGEADGGDCLVTLHVPGAACRRIHHRPLSAASRFLKRSLAAACQRDIRFCRLDHLPRKTWYPRRRLLLPRREGRSVNTMYEDRGGRKTSRDAGEDKRGNSIASPCPDCLLY